MRLRIDPRVRLTLIWVLYAAMLAATVYWAAFWAVETGGAPLPIAILIGTLFLAIPFIALSVIASLAVGFRKSAFVLLPSSLIVLLLFIVPWHPRLKFVNRLSHVRNGMTEREARQTMNGYTMSATSSWNEEFRTPEMPSMKITDYFTCRWNDTDAAYNADASNVYFFGGRVIYTDFSPD